MVSRKMASSTSFADVGNKELLEFYQNKFDEFQKKDDKYKETVDKHLKELVADRHELQEEVYRRGEKISDLQKALVDLQLSCFQEKERFLTVSAENERLKNNEELLHKSIQQLLKYTKDKKLRERIIYILQDPKVEVCYGYGERKSAESSQLPSLDKQSRTHDLRKQVQELQSKLDNFSQISKTNSDILLEDCKQALLESKEKIAEDEQEIRKLQKKLKETELELNELKHVSSQSQQDPRSKSYSYQVNYDESSNKENQSIPHSRKQHNGETNNLLLECQDICSRLKDVKFALISLSQISTKILQIFRNIFVSQTFINAANLQKTEFETQFVKEEDISQLQSLIRQSTRLSFEISTIWKSVKEYKSLSKISVPGIQKQLEQLEAVINSLAVTTAEVDLPAMRMSKETFFDYLTKPMQSSTRYGVKETSHSKYATEIIHMRKSVNLVNDKTENALNIIDQIIKRIEQNHMQENQVKLESLFAADKNRTHVKHIHFQDPLNLQKISTRSYEDTSDSWAFRRAHSDSIKNDVKRKIDKTLIKIEQIGNGEYFKDKECCKHLATEINALSEKLKSLYEDFNTRNLQDHFSEYSAVTLRKLETLAKQTRDDVLSAEAQISVYKSNVKSLSQKLKETEELLRESINECLGLKQKIQQMELEKYRGTAKYDEHSQGRLHKNSGNQDVETALKEVASSTKSTLNPKRPEGPYECMFCKQGKEHKLCEAKIRELKASERKLKTELKIIEQELKEAKKIAKMCQENLDKANLDCLSEKENVKETLQSLQSKNASLTEQLKVAKNRIKNMERYRSAVIEGFRTDIERYKSQIVGLQKQLAKASIICENDLKNLEFLKAAQVTAFQSKTAVGALKRLKAKLYEIETDIKHL